MDLIGPYTLKGKDKDKTVIDFMCITMINPATSWFEIAKLPISQPSELDIPMGTKGHKGKDKHIQQKQTYFDKTSATVETLVVSILYTIMEVNLNFTSRPSVIHNI
jgi:hypothetical protein